MNILIDCDDVLLDWQGAFRSYIAAYHGLTPDPALLDDWNMDTWLGCDSLPLIKEFNASQQFGYIPPRDDAAAVIPMLMEKGYNMIVISSCSDDKYAIARRKLNLYSEFAFAFSDIVCLPLGASKKSILEKMPPSIFIEDNVSHAKHGIAAGHETYVMRRNHNSKMQHEALNWVDSFYDLISRFT